MNTLGVQGEEAAARYLTKKGHKILARNFRTAGGELDIVSRLKKMLVFTEVKQRSYKAFGGPLAAVNKTKQHRIAKAAAAFIKSHKEVAYDEIRFDVICILGGEITHLENAFFPPRTTL